ncbi:hypothetical protein BTUL_0149g00170 [Botrytis tulipae]|uniref:Uncharacterized protein n=1 Tax=Botrytis tulipae TaxID=87230 RepID=A0A4Z1EHI3_9HELO|nr:hypothetical protein BTUL_0149g00170 [Botrytis tulipae]
MACQLFFFLWIAACNSSNPFDSPPGPKLKRQPFKQKFCPGIDKLANTLCTPSKCLEIAPDLGFPSTFFDFELPHTATSTTTLVG